MKVSKRRVVSEFSALQEKRMYCGRSCQHQTLETAHNSVVSLGNKLFVQSKRGAAPWGKLHVNKRIASWRSSAIPVTGSVFNHLHRVVQDHLGAA